MRLGFAERWGLEIRATLGAVVLALCLITGGCATAPVTPVSHDYFRALGEVPGEALVEAVDQVVVDNRGFVVERWDRQHATLYFETEWKERPPFPDEAAAGVGRARSRIVLRGPRSPGGNYRIILEGENQVVTDSIPSWHTAPVTVDFREWMGEIGGELRRHLDVP